MNKDATGSTLIPLSKLMPHSQSWRCHKSIKRNKNDSDPETPLLQIRNSSPTNLTGGVEKCIISKTCVIKFTQNIRKIPNFCQ